MTQVANSIRLELPLVMLLVAIGAYFLNPFWFGDGVWYALDIERGVKPVDAFHLVWTPLGALLTSLLNQPRALFALQIISAIGSGLLVVATFLLAQRLLPLRQHGDAFIASALIAATHFTVAYGASGSSYSAATACLTLALWLLLRRSSGWQLRDAVGASVMMIFSLAFWGVAILGAPALFAAAWCGASGRVVERLQKSLLLTLCIGLAWGLILLGSHTAFVTDKPFVAWYTEANAHTAGFRPSAIAVARAALGLIQSFVYLGSLGTSVKGLLLRDWELVRIEELLIPLAVLTTFLLLIGFGTFRTLRAKAAPSGALLFVTVAGFIPVAGFASLHSGSDVERFCLALPLLCIFLINVLPRGVSRALVALCLTINIACYAVPTRYLSPPIDYQLGAVAEKNLRPRSLVVVIGQTLGAKAGSLAEYFFAHKVHSINFETMMNPEIPWDQLLCDRIQAIRTGGGEVAVLSDLLQQPTPGGIGFSSREYPVPSREQMEIFFAAFTPGRRFAVDRFELVVLHGDCPKLP